MGVALILGTMIPNYFAAYPVNTGIYEIDQMLNILLTIKMLIGGFIAFVLDNLVSGS
jgi:solute carrier family 23 (nucleobase transporter), member 1